MGVIRSQDATRHEMHNARFTAYAAPSSGSRELCAWQVEIAPGTVGQEHVVSREEVLAILDGRLNVTIDGAMEQVCPGDVALVMAGSRLRLDNPHGEGARAWVTTSVGLTARLGDGSTVRPPWTL